ncbi:ALI_HP2_G0046280.mRNA.1.CDS.1 [Saccharomyces cerevisiae]|nr:ALI_HP2_G0046280.mRNA.1.CDS.1 [Saccharomyces cerevisiae]CAI6673250.1 ALI_HP2_G0046280.mRNA.1.CDS.1 [Saccharomyces cerevisiae]CAI6753853.1 ALI_HP1_G0046980.mRNA.1.CDS.1 [Saccharomyces cerevisiae]CAI6873656.1 ALI_collapsed_G0048400.mRNA.1.CDS.1 [Saccharomyces cerevisiae]
MKSFFLYLYVAFMFSCITALPLPVDNKRASSDSLDLKKKYAPDPPITHNVNIGIVFTDPESSEEAGRLITIDLYGTMVPKTVMTFCQYVDSVKDRLASRHSYSPERDFDKILSNGAIEGSSVSSSSIEETEMLAPKLPEENHSLIHDRPGRVSMIKDDKGLKFIIETNETPLEGESVVFGQVTAGLKDLMDKLANVKTDENGKPEQPITIGYISSQEHRVQHAKEAHEKYLQRLQDYQNGDLEKGITLKKYLYRGSQRKLEDAKYNQLHHPLPKIMLGISVLLLFYVLAKYRKRIFNRSSKIVSIRED